MYELKTIAQFGAAHRLNNIGGKCENLHGHNWRVETFVKGEELDKNGLLVDFKVIKEEGEDIIMKLDRKKTIRVRRIDSEENDDAIQIETFTRKNKNES